MVVPLKTLSLKEIFLNNEMFTCFIFETLKNHNIIYLEGSINYGLSLGNIIFIIKLSIFTINIAFVIKTLAAHFPQYSVVDKTLL